MKISKLFHWLYASLMVLPLVFVAPTALYYSFNQYAQPVSAEKSTIVEDGYYVDDGKGELISGNLADPSLVYFDSSDSCFKLPVPRVSGSVYVSFYTIDSLSGVEVGLSKNGAVFSAETTSGDDIIVIGFVNGDFENESIYFDLSLSSPNDFSSHYWNIMYCASSEPVPYTPYGARPTYKTETQTSTFPDVMTQAVDSTFNQPIFKWAKSSFFVQPFSFINNVFGMSNDNPLNYFLSYWFSISVCWLVFDVMMYVPNLVHRWLDKGAID